MVAQKLSATMASYRSIGVVGVGAMGEQMVINVAHKTDPDVRVYINDLNEAVVQRLCTDFTGKVNKCSTAGDVAERSVRSMLSVLEKTKDQWLTSVGPNVHHAARGPPREASISG